MFKKFSPPSLSKEPAEPLTPHALASELVASLNQEELQTTITEGVSILGTLRFEGILRIDGFFEGKLESSGTLIVGPKGVVISDLNLKEAFISGKVKGNITVREQLSLRGRAEVEGDICSPLLSVDEGVSLKGNLQIADIKPAQEELLDDEHYSSDN